MNSQFAERRSYPFNPWSLGPDTRPTILTRTMLLLDTINNQNLNRYTLLGQKLKIPLRLENTHRFGNREERKTRLLSIVKHCSHGLDSLTQITQKNINLISNHAAPRKMRNDVTMLLAH